MAGRDYWQQGWQPIETLKTRTLGWAHERQVTATLGPLQHIIETNLQVEMKGLPPKLTYF